MNEAAVDTDAGSADAFDADKLVGNYVKLRDYVKAVEKHFKDECDAHLAKYKEGMDSIEQRLLNHLKDTNAENLKAASGTAYISAKKSATIKDKDAFLRHVIGTENWDLLDLKANVTAIEEAMAATADDHGAMEEVPGVKWSVFNKIGVRRA